MRPGRFLPIVLIVAALLCLIGVYAAPEWLAQPTQAVPPASATAGPALPSPGSAATETPAAASLPPLAPTLPPPTETLMPTAEPTASFAVIGDYGEAGQASASVSALVKSWNPDFIITVGDNNYPNGEADTIDANIGQYYHEFIASYAGSYGPGSAENRFFPALGNHDLYSEGGKPYFDYFTLPGNERYYDFQWGPVHLFALNGDPSEPDGFRTGTVQAAWLEQGLAASTAPWKIVYLHQAPYSSGYQGSSVWMQWPYAAWGASAVLAGHDHLYERLEIDAIPYFVNGVGGGAIYSFNEPLPGSQARFNGDYGAMRVQADPHRITFDFLTRSGEVIDSLTLQKESGQ